LGSFVAAVFLVEDEALLRMMTAEMLEELGHRVVAEAGTISAAEPLARNAEFDLALLDINIGGSNIAPIAHIIADRGLPFIFVSGYGSEGRPQPFQDRPALRKPFLIESLSEMIDKALSASGRHSLG
jgi:CheY-like chemotaxis protein